MLPSNELQPWLITIGEGASAKLACWKSSGSGDVSLAMFSSDTKAILYAEQNCQAPWMIVRPQRNALLQLLIDSFRAGIENAVLDPSDIGARSFFPLREVLKAAKAQLVSEQLN